MRLWVVLQFLDLLDYGVVGLHLDCLVLVGEIQDSVVSFVRLPVAFVVLLDDLNHVVFRDLNILLRLSCESQLLDS